MKLPIVSIQEMIEQAKSERDHLNPKKTGFITVGNHYRIENERIDSDEKLLRWIRHLAGKSWFNAEALWYLLEDYGALTGHDFYGPL